jgi:tRNA-2-methylthio-N6-dimethylallyladenosine synthase
MNEHDSEHLFAELHEKEGYERTDRAEEADLILINTCSVRERPVAKLFSELGAFNLIRKERAKIGVCGCTASALGGKLFARAPYVDFVLGARNVSKITEAIKKSRSVFTDANYDESEFAFAESRLNKYRALINISIGCDKQCAYCIVPATRGREISIPSKLILDEAERAAGSGAVEIVLLGQNVNSYGSRFSSSHKKIDFPELLEQISLINGLKRIRFQSPHPLHIDDRFLDVFANNPKISKHIHIPLQSGSTKILRAMRRGYTKEWYVDRALKIREMVKDVTISTDIIVGFPGESEEDFEESLDVMRRVKFEQLFSFKFSPRELTAAALMDNQIEDKTAAKRLSRVQALYKKQLNEAVNAQIGREFDVFLELSGDRETLYGKSHNFYSFRVSKGAKEGEFVKVRAVGVKNGALIGEVVEQTR